MHSWAGAQSMLAKVAHVYPVVCDLTTASVARFEMTDPASVGTCVFGMAFTDNVALFVR
jgi:1,4-dihydroxy-2-naphthoyl-CoA synthase